MDDTQSILRCCNKVYLQDAFAYQKVPAPKATFVSSATDEVCEKLIADFGLPLVLKLPESSFSRGVHKAENKEALKTRLEQMLAESALVLVQEYIFTEFDWRIGVLGGKPIYACQYFMVRNHWQIYNHQGDRFSSGGFATMPTFEVPKPVLQAAIKAAKAVGDGLYGVDIKQTGNAVYVIEVNDNPSIDSGVEDKYLGKELYELIMQEFADRLEQRGR
jgi:glutathione synthase/RimK-type ligase-like ATP-grasp enzyme